MNSELEGLIASLVILVSCSGENGCPVSQVVDAIKKSSLLTSKASASSLKQEGQAESPPWSNHAASTLWKWLLSRNDISLAPHGPWDPLSLEEIVATIGPEAREPEGSSSSNRQPKPTSKSSDENVLKLYASEELMWECIAGHPRDYKRLPKSEWSLLLGIASSQHSGILQGDLGRLTDQDKRSVPKRTDALTTKGYVVKRVVLVRGTRTSKLWLRRFAPVLVEVDEDDHPGPELAFSRELLLETLDPVPWHSRWTTEAIDFKALALTTLAITKEWNVIRISDLKLKLGVLRSRWHQKVAAKLLRRLADVGSVQYVAAQLQAKVFKDCVRYVGEVSPDGWAHVLTAKKNTSKAFTMKESDGGAECGDVQDDTAAVANHPSHEKALDVPPWTVDKPFISTVTKSVSAWGTPGATNAAISTFTLGPTFKRYIGSTSTALAKNPLQPSHLRHLQMSKQWVQSGSVAFFQLSVPDEADQTVPAPVVSTGLSATSEFFDFGVPNGSVHSSLSLGELCNIRLSAQGTRGRPKKKTLPGQVHGSPEVEAINTSRHVQEQLNGRDSFIVCLKVSPGALRSLEQGRLATLPTHTSEVSDAGDSPVPEQSENKQTDNVEEPAPSDGEIEDQKEDSVRQDGDKDVKNERLSGIPRDGSRGRGRGRSRGRGRLSRGRGRGRGRGGGLEPEHKAEAAQEAGAESWTCEKCGGQWKGENGLKYHLEKSRTPCNSSWVRPHPPSPSSPPTPGNSRQLRRTSTRKQNDDGKVSHEISSDQQVSTASMKTSDRGYSLGNFKSSDMGPKKVIQILKSTISTAKIVDLLQRDKTLLTLPNSLSRQPVETTRRDRAANHLPVINVDRLRPELYHPAQEMDNTNQTRTDAVPQVVQAHVDGATASRVSMLTDQDGQHSPTLGTGQASAPALPGTSNYRMHVVASSILQNQNGSILGGDDFLRTLSEELVVRYPEAKTPSLRACKVGINKLINARLLREHWHGFCLPNGKYKRCQVISLPNIEAFSPEVLDVVEQFKTSELKEYEANGTTYPHTEGDTALGSRRPLPSEIVTLDAPLYVAQASRRRSRFRDIEEEWENRSSRLTKPSRGRGSRGRDNRTREAYRWALNSNHGARLEAALADDLTTVIDTPFSVRFLEPNKYLEEEDSPHLEDHPKLTSRRRDGWPNLVHHVGEHALQAASAVELIDPTLISGRFAAWPSLSPSVFESGRASFAMDGWMPSLDWFRVWDQFPSAIEKRLKVLRFRLGYKYKEVPTPYQIFLERLFACMNVELDWAERFQKASSRAAGPHLLFIQFPMRGKLVPNTYEQIDWPVDEQLTSASNHRIAKEVAALPWSASDDEDDSDAPIDVGLDFTLDSLPRSRRQTKIKRVGLRVRRLTDYPSDRGMHEDPDAGTLNDSSYNVDELMAAFVMVRVMLGGTEKFVDWALLMKLFPDLSLTALRKFWSETRKSWRAQYEKLTREFQERIIPAFEEEEIPMIDYDNVASYDWTGLLNWTLRIPKSLWVDIPATREEFGALYGSDEVRCLDEDWRARFYDAQSSVYSRYEDATSDPAAKGLNDGHAEPHHPISVTETDVVRSWIRSLCCTTQDSHAVDEVHQRFLSLFGGESSHANDLMREAIEQLTRARVITRDKRPGLVGRPYRLHDSVETTLSKMAYRDKYKEAGVFKGALDEAFRDQGYFILPHDINDGTTMALINLYAHGRINLTHHGVPQIPYGFEPGHYEIRKLPKHYYQFDLHIIPAASYLYNEQIDQVMAIADTPPPAVGGMGEIPQWIDFFGNHLPVRWADILGAVCFAYSTRGSLSLEGITATLQPVLEGYEVPLIMSWGQKTGVLKRLHGGGGMTVAEWWWLAVAQLHMSVSTDMGDI